MANPYLDALQGKTVKTTSKSSNPYLDVLSTPIIQTPKSGVYEMKTTLGLTGPSAGSFYTSGKQEESKKEYGGEESVSGSQRDHIIPWALAGTSNENNIRIEKMINEAGTATDPIEKQAINDYKAGKINLQEARVKVLGQKQIQELSNEGIKQGVIANLPSAVKETVGGFVKGLLSPFVSAGVSAVNVARETGATVKAVATGQKTVPDYLSKSYNIPIYGKAEPMFTGKENTKEMAQKVVGNALEIAPYFIGVPEAKGLIKTIDTIGKKSLQEITAKEATQFAKAYGAKVATSALGLGTMFGAGTSIKEGADAKQTAKNIAKSVGMVALLETTLSPLIKYGLKMKEGNVKENVDKVISDHQDLITKKAEEIKSQQEATNPYKLALKQPEQPIGAVLPEETIKYPPKTKKVATKSILEAEIKILNKDVIKTKSQLTDIWNKAQEKPLEAPITEQTVKPTPEPQTPQIGGKTSEISPNGKISGTAKLISDKAMEDKLALELKNLTEVEKRNFIEERKQARDLINSDIEKSRAVVRGEEPSNIRAGAMIDEMYEYAKSHPEQAGDIVQELANSPLNATISVGASETSFARMINRDFADLYEVKKTYEKKVSNLKNKKTNLKKLLDKEIETELTKKEGLSLDKFLDEITC